MSRQFDEYMEGKFEVRGEQYEIIDPTNLGTLALALEARDAIQYMLDGLMHDEDPSQWESLLNEQQGYIDEYIERLGEFDNTKLRNNINYLIKNSDLGTGDVEKLLKISTGYLSRTLKEGAQKRISIDILWKLAALFEVDIESLLSTDIRFSESNSDLIARFLIKLKRDTSEGKINWEIDGGYEMELADRFLEMKIMADQDQEDYNDEYSYIYYPEHLNKEMKWFLAGDIITCKNFVDGKDLVMFPYASARTESIRGIDSLFVWKEDAEWKWQKVFYTADECMGHLDERAKNFYDWVIALEYDAKVTPDVKNVIMDYLRGI